VVKRSKVRRAKLYHIREKAAKEIRRQMRNVRLAKEVEPEQVQDGAGVEPGETQDEVVVEEGSVEEKVEAEIK
jgi:hypothetical protein